MIIRKKQIDALSRSAIERFENRMVRHVRDIYPQKVKRLTDERLRELISLGIENARAYGVVLECDVQIYIERMFIHSPSFDTDERTAWAARVLQEESLSGSDKMLLIKARDDVSSRVGK